MVNRSSLHKLTPHLFATDDPLAQAILQCCGPDTVAAYHQGRPYCLGDVHWVTMTETIKGGLILFVGQKLQKGRHYDNAKYERMMKKRRIKTTLNLNTNLNMP